MKMTNYLARGMLCSSIVLIAACGNDTESALDGAPTVESSSTGQSSLTLNITDAPVDDAKAVVMEITGVSIKAEGKAEELVFDFDAPKSVDLLALQGSSFESLLDDVELPAGNYKSVSLLANAEEDQVLDSFIEFKDGTMKELHIPSASKSGLKIKTDLTLVEGEASEYTIDFDLRKSLRVSKDSESAMLKPSLRMVNNKNSGHMSGFIGHGLMSEACADDETGAVYVYAGADVVPSDYSGLETDPVASSLIKEMNEGHKYGVGFLEKGEYTLAYTCDAALDTPDAVESLVFLSTATIELKAKSTGRNDFHSKGGMHSGRSDGRKGVDGMMSEGRHMQGLSKTDRAAKQAEWDALSEEEKAAMQAEWEEKRSSFKGNNAAKKGGMSEEDKAARDAERAKLKAEHDAKKAEWQAEAAAKKAEWDALSDEEKAAAQAEKKAEREAQKAEWDAKRAEERAAWDAERAAFLALTDEEKAAEKAKREAEYAAKKAEREAEKAAWDALSDEEKKAAREAKKAEFEAARKAGKSA